MGKIREEMEKVARENAIKDLKELQIDIGSSPDDLENSPLYYALDMAIKALEQQPCEDCDCIRRAYVESIVEELENICINGDEYILSLLSNIKNAPSVTPTISKMEQVEDRIRELIREFDNEHPALFADYMQEFNNHPISEIIEYMWDMYDLIEDIKYRLPNKGDAESEENADG